MELENQNLMLDGLQKTIFCRCQDSVGFRHNFDAFLSALEATFMTFGALETGLVSIFDELLSVFHTKSIG